MSTKTVGGTVEGKTLKITPVIPEQYLVPGEASVMAVAKISTPNRDGKNVDVGYFAAEFSMNYKTCTPSLTSSGRLK